MNAAKSNKTKLALSAMMTVGLSAFAQINANYQANYTSGSFYDSSIGVNLLTAGQSSLTGVTAPTGSLSSIFPATGINDGSGAGNGNYTYYSVNDSNGGATVMPDTIVFQLSQGYDITSIQAFSGWGDHNLGEQSFQLLLSIGGGAFTSYGTFVNNASVTTGGSAAGSYLTTLTPGSGSIGNVTGIEFIFSNPDASNGLGAVGNSQAGGGSSGGTVIHELEAFGTLTVPEPSATALMCLAGAICVVYRRKASC